MDLTPTQLHYLKRELISEQLLEEISKLKHNLDLDAVLHAKNDPGNDYPLLRYISNQFVIEFPLLKHGSNPEFWSKCQQFLNDFAKVKLDTYTPRKTGASQRRILMYKLQKLMTVALCATVKTVQGEEQGIKVDPSSVQQQPKEDNAEDKALAQAVDQSMTLLENDDRYLEWMGFNGLALNVVTVRDMTEKRTLREKTHTEFIVCTYMEGHAEPVFVARRHGDFRQLAQDLAAEYPTEDVPGPPRKASDALSDATDEGSEKQHTLHLRSPRRRSSSKSNNPLPSHFYREQDRLLLRSFLRRIATEPRLAKSQILKRFLTENAITLTESQVADADMRDKMDKARAEEEAKFRNEVDQKMAELNDLLDMLKKQIMQPGGLIEIFNIIKTTEKIEELPPALRKAFEWGRINFAFVLHTQFVTSDRSAENIANLKRTNMLMPYRAIAQLLKLSNPFAMVKGILDLFLTQPFGRRSLLQRIIASNMNDNAKQLQQDINNLEAKISDPALCQKIKNAIETPISDDIVTQRTRVRSTVDETLDMLKNADIEPALTPEQIVKVAGAKDSSNMESRLLVTQLHQLWAMYARQREHRILGELMFQGATGDLLREIFAMFYQPLAEVYRAANIGDSLQHLSAFIDDLIGVIDSLDMQDITNTAQPFVQLVQRHEQQFYHFVHQVHANDKTRLFDELLSYVDNTFALVAHGLPQRIDLDKVIEDAGVSAKDAALQKDIDAICEYHRKRKDQHMKRRRQKLMMEENDDVAMASEAFDFLPNKSEVMGVFQDLAELDDEELEDDLYSESGSDTSSAVAHEMTIEMPDLEVVPKIVPYFVNSIVNAMK